MAYMECRSKFKGVRYYAIRDSVGSYANVMKHLKKTTDVSFFRNFFSKL